MNALVLSRRGFERKKGRKNEGHRERDRKKGEKRKTSKAMFQSETPRRQWQVLIRQAPS